jgi:hypothetical protein
MQKLNEILKDQIVILQRIKLHILLYLSSKNLIWHE